MNGKAIFLILLLSTVVFAGYGQRKEKPVNFEHGKLQVSENRRFLQHEDGTPFFYLGDTAWELFHRLNREDAVIYLSDRARKGFTVIQAVAIAELDGDKVPNPYGHVPFVNRDPARPALTEGIDDYWDHVDYIVDKANELGMYIGLLPTWGRYWHDEQSLLFNPQNAFAYGQFLGQRYKDRQVIWILGGDRNIDNDNQRRIIQEMARGIEEGDGTHLITYHPGGARGSSEWFHQEAWLDFNMRENGHNADYTNVYVHTFNDYNKQPAKPVIDGEPLYEDHPLSFNAARLGHSVAADVRRPLYWNLFNGAFGYTYGHHSVWQMYDPGKTNPVNTPLMSWRQAIRQPGAGQMVYGRLLIESRPYFTRIPDPSVIVTDKVPTAVPGEGRYRFTATRDEAGTYAMVYAPVGRAFTVRTDVLKGEKIKAWWYNPRNGEATKIGTFRNDRKERTFISPDPGELTDWILVLDDAGYKYPAPGKR